MIIKKIGLLLVICICTLALLPGCTDSGEGASSSSPDSLAECTILVKTEGGMPLSDIGVYVYNDSEGNDLLWAGETDKDGKASFKAALSENCNAVLKNLPDGYNAQKSYPISSVSTEISLETVLLDGSDMTGLTYELGDIIRDFTVTAVDGTEYRMSELLEENKAVILNFWFLGCGPCRIEFPHMQEAYEDYSDKIEILALNPYDGTAETVSQYADETGLTFPMAVADAEWQSCMNLTAYPTTVVIDRYGMIAMIHKGSIPDADVFRKLFGYFTSDDYQQATIRNLSDIQ